jgi:hypothetical protein
VAVAAAEARAGEEKAGVTVVIARSACDEAIQSEASGLLRSSEGALHRPVGSQ